MRLNKLVAGGMTPFLIGALAINLNAQTVHEGSDASALYEDAIKVRESDHSSFPSYIKFNESANIKSDDAINWSKRNFGLDFQNGFELLNSHTDELGHTHYRYQQTYNGLPLEGTMWIVHTNGGMVYSMNGFILESVGGSAIPGMTEESALGYALDHIGADEYKWERAEEERHIKWETDDPDATFYPEGELVYVTNGHEWTKEDYHLAYKFNVYAHAPVGRWEIYVDAITGEILFQNEIIHHVDTPGTAETVYSGTQTITADSFGGSYRLRETGRGNGIRTFDMNEGTSYGAAVDFTDADNYWNNVNAQLDEYATDAHYGAEMTYDYFWLQHGRNSIDGAGFRLDSYIHYDVSYANAFWDGSRMTYGDGGGGWNPLVAMDIAAHEITHGLTTFTAGLVYQDESGALNESFSDIFGTCVEEYGQPTYDWLVGEDIGGALRSMSNPNSYGDPDTYFGANWAPLGGPDNGGVHTNSGVQNFWFYLLTEGGSGTNDNGDAYTVNGLGFADASSIAFRNLTVYLGVNSQFADARFYAIESAVDLFGACTPEVEATTNAWYAVGVGPEYVAAVIADFTPNTYGGCDLPMTIDFTNTSNNGSTFQWDFGDGNTSTGTNPSNTYTSNGVYTVELIADGGLCGIDTLLAVNTIYVGQLPDPNVTDGTRCDPGTVDLTATGGGQLSWYTMPTGGSPIATGSSYTTPSIGSTTTYYVEAETGLGPEFLGAVDNSIGGGGYFNGDQHLVFDAHRPFELRSVWVDANGSGNRTIELRDNTGAVIQSATINIPNGQSTVMLNFNVPAGTDHQLGVTNGSNPDLYRNNSGPAYPYTVPSGAATITESSAGTPGYYYFFYNWEIVETPCSSDRVPVTAYIAAPPTTTDDSRCGPGTVNLAAAGGAGTLEWYDAPTGGSLVNIGTGYSVLLSTTTTYYVQEEVIPGVNDYVGPADNSFGGGGYFNGDQHLVFDVAQACNLVSVWVDANGAGNRTIELRDNTGAVLQSTTVNVPNGTSRVTLNFPLTPGSNYQLGWANGSNPDLYRNNSGPSYPYDLAGWVTINTSSAGPDYYYCFYDWEIVQTGCTTSRVPVTGTINSASDATINSVAPVCASDAPFNLTAADPGGTWSGTGITDAVNGTFDPSVAGSGTWTVTYTITGTCGATDTEDITVAAAYDATITPTSSMCTGDAAINLTAVDGGGTWSGTGITDAVNGTFDPATAGAGTHTITYTIAGSCGDTDTEDIVVNTSMDATITPVGSLCDDDAPVTMTAVDGGGVWSGTGMTGADFDPAAAGPGTHTITYTISGTCGDTDTEDIVVGAVGDATITPAGPFCDTDGWTALTSTDPGGTWSANCVGCINVTTGMFNPSVAGVGTYEVIYALPGSCGDADTITVTVNNCATGIWDYDNGIEFGLYPNPANDQVTVEINGQLSGMATLEILNTIGQVVHAQQVQLAGGTVETIDLSAFERGIYFIRVSNQDLSTSKKLIRQ